MNRMLSRSTYPYRDCSTAKLVIKLRGRYLFEITCYYIFNREVSSGIWLHH